MICLALQRKWVKMIFFSSKHLVIRSVFIPIPKKGNDKEYSGLISFRIDWVYLLAGTLKSLLQQQSLKALSLLYGPTLTSIHDYWKTIAFTGWTFVGKVMSLLFNMLSTIQYFKL